MRQQRRFTKEFEEEQFSWSGRAAARSARSRRTWGSVCRRWSAGSAKAGIARWPHPAGRTKRTLSRS